MRWLPPHIEYGGHRHTGAQLAACTDSLAGQFARHRASLASTPEAA
jgi:hypothetical protein